jgi:hypothetical protein
VGHEFEESVRAGDDIAIWINGPQLFIGAIAIIAAAAPAFPDG